MYNKVFPYCTYCARKNAIRLWGGGGVSRPNISPTGTPSGCTHTGSCALWGPCMSFLWGSPQKTLPDHLPILLIFKLLPFLSVNIQLITFPGNLSK